MKAARLAIPDVLLIEPEVFSDSRGFFLESYNKLQFDEIVGYPVNFVQDNHSRSSKNVLRGLHYQIKEPQGKLVRVLQGEIFDVVVDLRKDSKTFRKWLGIYLSAKNNQQLWIPEGFAHGFLALSETVEVIYKTNNYYAPEHERSLLWCDPELAIEWPITGVPILSNKDTLANRLAEAEVFI